jgi:hypothetical protein
MPRGREELTSGASGRAALAVFRDEDFEDFIALVRWLPTFARTEGYAAAIGLWRTEGRSLVALFRLKRPENADEWALSEGVSSFFSGGVSRLLCDPDEAGFNAQTAIIESVERFLFEPSVRAVFERSAPSEVKPYVPHLPP